MWTKKKGTKPFMIIFLRYALSSMYEAGKAITQTKYGKHLFIDSTLWILKSCDQVSSAVQRFSNDSILYRFTVVLIFCCLFFFLLRRSVACTLVHISNKGERKVNINRNRVWSGSRWTNPRERERERQWEKNAYWIAFHIAPEQLIQVWSSVFVWTFKL